MKNQSPLLLTTLLTALLCTALPVAAQMYKWVDANGKIVYSDQPPVGKVKSQEKISRGGGKQTQAETTPTDTAPGASEAAKPADPPKAAAEPPKGPMTTAEREADYKKRKKEQEDAAAKKTKEAEEEKEKKKNCDQTRAQLKSLEDGGRATKLGPSGETIFLEDKERAAEVANVRRAADSWCK